MDAADIAIYKCECGGVYAVENMVVGDYCIAAYHDSNFQWNGNCELSGCETILGGNSVACVRCLCHSSHLCDASATAMATAIVTYQNGVKKTTHTEQHEQKKKNFRPVYMCIMDGDGDGNVSMEKSVCFFSFMHKEKSTYLPYIICICLLHKWIHT